MKWRVERCQRLPQGRTRKGRERDEKEIGEKRGEKREKEEGRGIGEEERRREKIQERALDH
jgi:hypothetical protein